jgi:hypothetical protein
MLLNNTPYENYMGRMNNNSQNLLSNQFLKCRPVSSKEEARAFQIDLDGSLWVFTDLGNDNYAPLFTEIVFNFFISPKIQDMYDIGLLKYKSMKHINRIIRNICFNMEFPQDDKCWLFNEKLKEQNRMITSFIKDDIIDNLMNDIKENKVEEILQCEMNGDMFGYPICLYSAAWKSVEKHLDIKDLMS